jgi:hypothetical protein
LKVKEIKKVAQVTQFEFEQACQFPQIGARGTVIFFLYVEAL